MNGTKPLWIVFVFIIAMLLLAACGGNVSAQPTNSGQIEGVLVQETSGLAVDGTVNLMAEKFLTATPPSTATLQPDEGIKVNIGKDYKFAINNIKPGRYYLDVSVSLNPCFLGAPGEVFNGMEVSFMENWSPMGLSFKDGSSMIMGKTEVYDISAGKPLKVTLQLPKCY